MKKLFVTLFLSFLFFWLKAQSVSLKQGDEFSYRTSSYYHGHFINADEKVDRLDEHISCHQITFKVIEVLPQKKYKLKAQYEELNNYYRSKKQTDEQWQTGINYDRTLRNKFSNFNMPEYTIEFTLSEKGEITEPEVINRSTPTSREHFSDSLLIRMFQSRSKEFFSGLPKKLRQGQQVEINNQNYVVAEINNNHAILNSLDVGGIHHASEAQVLFNLNNGLLLEKNVYEDRLGVEQKIKNPGNDLVTDTKGTTDIVLISRCSLVTNNKEPYYTYKYQKNDHIKDSTLLETNVTIRGKIINPSTDRNVSVEWAESVPNAYNRYGINTRLNDDNTFEIRLHIDRLQKVTFRQHEVSTFYLAPGDDLFITVDMNAFDETITATGPGSNDLNFSFKRFLFDETEQLDIRKIYNVVREKYAELNPSELKKYVINTLDKKQNFLNNNRRWLSPEQYLAEFWENQITMVDILKNYPRSQSYYRKQAGKEPYHIDKKEFYNSEFYSLIHPDNDMMAYYEGYDHFIREYVFFFLNEKMDEITGKGNVVTVNNFFDDIYSSRYGFSNSFFTGVSQYTLKYQAVSDALRRASWDTFVDLFNQFKIEYPDAHKTTLLYEAYEKAKKVAPGQPAFNFKLSGFDGNKVSLSDFRGKVVYIDFWSTSCGPCRGSIERYGKEMEGAFKDKDIVLLYIALEGDVKRPKEFMEEQGIEGVQLIAKGDEEAQIREKYYFDAIPHYYIIDKEGRIVKREAPAPYEIVKDHSILLDVLEPK
ncbi:TlpA family protein disulfide reductase [Saccharicrinis sp. FJH2]|uniref:TlpA family protein disulfide reductase n=1 Tax=Saccharicrinis sp. FJH65 TaxID=3344659 RepID=UPI0035F41A4E